MVVSQSLQYVLLIAKVQLVLTTGRLETRRICTSAPPRLQRERSETSTYVLRKRRTTDLRSSVQGTGSFPPVARLFYVLGFQQYVRMGCSYKSTCTFVHWEFLSWTSRSREIKLRKFFRYSLVLHNSQNSTLDSSIV